jgi:DNA-binding FrmR family transcriptional regulator
MKKINNRINRAIGQLEGVKRMIEKQGDCEEVIIQFQAVKSAIDSAYREFLNDNLENCLKKRDAGNMEKIVKQISKK